MPPGAAPSPEGAETPPGEEEEDSGDFLAALQLMRKGAPDQYVWQDMGVVKVSATGLPLHRWYDPLKKQARIQSVPPGQGRRKQFGRPEANAQLPPAVLMIDEGTKNDIAQALALMFEDWVKVDGLPKLFGAPDGSQVKADVARGDDGSLDIVAQEGETSWKLSLEPSGELIMRCAKADDQKLEAAAKALCAAGADKLQDESGSAYDLTRPPSDAGIPRAVLRGNWKRRRKRHENIKALLESADEFAPPQAQEEPEEPGLAPEQKARLDQAVAYLRGQGRHLTAERLIQAAQEAVHG
jgi:hypothetical protein